MAIRIKRSSGDTAPALLESGQLAYVEGATNGGTLYYGEIGGTVRAIAGKKYIDKLDGIEAGAEVNLVDSVNGQTGVVVLDVGDISGAEATANKGQANGYASLDGDGKVPSAQLPSYVDDVLEYANLAGFPATGSSGIIYVAQDTNKVYRWSGSTYIEISPSPGSTDSVTEGSTNLYYTDARARAAVSATDAGGDGSFSYNSSTGVFTYTGPSASDVRAHFTAGTGITITSGEIATTITQYTDAAARAAVSATDAGGDGSFTYNSSTGVFTYTGPGTSDYRAAFSAGTAISITDGVIAFTGTQATGNELENVVEDTTPQLGGNLDVNGNSIVSASNGDIAITPNGTGKIVLDGLNWPTADGTANYVLKTDGAGQLSWVAQTAGVTAFTGLSDVPSAYTGSGGYYVKVNSSANALEFSQHVDDGTF